MSLRVEHRLGVPTPAEVIWKIVSDLDGWSAWNPTYAKASGRLAIGAPITLDAKWPGLEPVHAKGTIIDWVPDTQLLWRVRLGMFTTSLRYIEIEKLGDANCLLANGEIIQGFGARSVPRRRRAAAYAGYEAMNLAVRTRATEMWRAAGRNPT